MKILIPILHFDRTGGYRVLSELASHWSRNGHQVAFVTTEWSVPPLFPTEAEVIWIDDRGQRVANCRGTYRGKWWNVIRTLVALRRALAFRAESVDVIFANHSLTAWPAWLAGGRALKVYYIQAYEPEFYWSGTGAASRLLGLLAWLSYCLPLKRVVNAPVYLRFRNLRSDYCIPPGIDLTIFMPGERSSNARSDDRSLIIGCIGRLEPFKGTHIVVDAFQSLRSRGVPVTLHIAFGNVSDEVAALAGIRVIRPADDRELAQFYRELDILIAPGTIQFGTPHYPVMEAMACGTAVVNSGYMPATQENSIIVKPSAEEIAEATMQLYNNPAMATALKNRALLDVKSYGWPQVALKFESLFLSARAPGPS